ncbi:MAG TPA: hypothetical protein VLE69_03335 [Candidatus Saccharimonadales bacterium]|nr:hypothetical protein [Candidatus Saccharimonadales bacterium]
MKKKLLIVVALCALIAIVWLVLASTRSSQNNDINSFETCAAAGNPILETFPEQCRANGKTYTKP